MIVLSYLVYQFYSASIVSNLLIKPKTLIKSVEDILKSTMRAGCEDILYNRDYFLVSIMGRTCHASGGLCHEVDQKNILLYV